MGERNHHPQDLVGYLVGKWTGPVHCRSLPTEAHEQQRVSLPPHENGWMPPICEPGRVEPPDASALAFINLKAPFVFHILDRRLGKSGTSLDLSRVLHKILVSAISGEMPHVFAFFSADLQEGQRR